MIRANGASFCQVAMISPVGRSSPCITGGIQKCKGARPTFSARAMVVSAVATGWDKQQIFHSPVVQALIVLANRMVAAAAAWAKKYLVAASTARGWWCWVISGRIASVLISRPIQARSQWELMKVRVVPSPRLDNKIVIR